MKEIPFVEMQDWAKVDKPLPDGNYAVITYRPGMTKDNRLRLPNAFPWMARIYAFKGGHHNDIACGSDLGDVIIRHNAAKVCLVGLSAELRSELDLMLAKKGIKLVHGLVDA